LIRDILRNPFYAGAYIWGRRPVTTLLVDGRLEKRYGAGLPLDSPIRPGPHHPPLVGIAAVAELLGAPAFFARIAPRRSGNLSAPPMAIGGASDLINRVVRADAAHARHNAGRLPHDHPKSTTDPKFPGDLRTSKSVPNPAGGPCLPDY
jgi:hypothetical protein